MQKEKSKIRTVLSILKGLFFLLQTVFDKTLRGAAGSQLYADDAHFEARGYKYTGKCPAGQLPANGAEKQAEAFLKRASVCGVLRHTRGEVHSA